MSTHDQEQDDFGSIGNRLRVLRENENISEIEAAKMLDLPLIELQQLERDHRKINTRRLLLACESYNADAQWIMFGNKNPSTTGAI